MLRVFRAPLLASVPYASLFTHNVVLEEVFKSPRDKIAVTVEMAGMPKASYSYGQLCQDVIRLADLLVERREAVARARNESSLSWLQPQRPAHIRSLFAQVSLLASWAINQLTTVLPAVLTRNELMRELRHSGSRMILGETSLFKDKLPTEYETLLVCAKSEVSHVSTAAKLSSLGDSHAVCPVDSIVDTQSVLSDLCSNSDQKATEETLMAELLKPARGGYVAMETAEDIVNRLQEEKTNAQKAQSDRFEDLLRAQHKERNTVPDTESSQDLFCFDSERVGVLNAVFRRWYTDPASRPREHEDCLLLYTSGTTGTPKGVVHTHASVSNMVRMLQKSWQWSSNDSILHVLPLSHIHGLANVLLCALASQARCVFTKFDNPSRVAHRLEQGDITLFMAVPSIYTKMIAAIHTTFSPIERTGFRKACAQAVRLMVSGSSALPVPVLQQFRDLSGHTLLERYGMTEIGMALGQPLRPISARIPGTVGSPFPSVKPYIFQSEAFTPDPTLQSLEGFEDKAQTMGVLCIASASMFDRYWNDPESTRKELCTSADGTRFFVTGDTVRVGYLLDGEPHPPVFTIMGRTSVDIIKSSGNKLSALEIEAGMLRHGDIFYEVAVVGIKHVERGEELIAVVALHSKAVEAYAIEYNPDTNTYESDVFNNEMRKVISDVLAPYKRPRRFICVPQIPRNENGKVNKVQLKRALKLE